MAVRTVTLDELRQLVTDLGYRAVSRQASVIHGTLARFAAGKPIQTDTLKKVVNALEVKVLVD